MKKAAVSDLSVLLKKAGDGDKEAFSSIWPEVYAELHKMAAIYLSKNKRSETMRPTAMVSEAYLKLLNANGAKFENRIHFYAVGAIIMRQILIDYVRKKGRNKRGGKDVQVFFDENFHSPGDKEQGVDLILLNQALEKLGQEDPHLCQIVELKFFGGLNIEEMAEYLNTSASTIKRQWHVARLWLYHELSSEKED